MAAWMLPAAIFGSSLLGALGQNKAAKESATSTETATTAPWGPLQQYLIGGGDVPSYITNSPKVSDEWKQWNDDAAGGKNTNSPPKMLAANQQGWAATNPEKKTTETGKPAEDYSISPAIAKLVLDLFGNTSGTVQSNPNYNDSGGIEGGQSAVSRYVYNDVIPEEVYRAAGYSSSNDYRTTRQSGGGR